MTGKQTLTPTTATKKMVAGEAQRMAQELSTLFRIAAQANDDALIAGTCSGANVLLGRIAALTATLEALRAIQHP